MAGVEFVGDLGSGMSVDSTSAPNAGGSKSDDVQFVGDGAKDVSHSNETNSGGSEQIPNGGGVKFVG